MKAIMLVLMIGGLTRRGGEGEGVAGVAMTGAYLGDNEDTEK